MIEVEIKQDMLDRAGHETLVGRRICESLHQAGIPVLGEFAIRGVSKGALAMTSENDLGAAVHAFTWREDEDDTEVKPLSRYNLKNGSVVRKTGRHYEDDEL